MTALLALLLAANAPLKQARADYENLDFEKCVATLESAAEEGGTRAELRDIQLWSGLCHFNLGHRRTAARAFQDALRIDPDAALPDFVSPKALELFARVRKAVVEEARAFVDDDLPDDAPKEVVLVPKPPPPPPLGVAPEVWRKNAGPIALGGVSVAALAIGVGLGAHAKTLEAQANKATWESDFVSLGNAAKDNAVAANVALGVAVTAAAASVVTYFLLKEDDAEPRR